MTTKGPSSDYRNRITLRNLGLIRLKRIPEIACPILRREKCFLEHISAQRLSSEATHSVRILMTILSKCKCNPCAHRSKGNMGHRDESHHIFATVLSISNVVNFPLQNSVNVSKVINAATNSATQILLWQTASFLRSFISPSSF